MRNPLKRSGGEAPSAGGGRPLELVVAEAPVPPAATPDPAATVAAVPRQEAVAAERSKRHAELVARRAGRRADEAEAAVRETSARLDRIEHELAGALTETERLRAELARAEHKRRQAEQLAHSEAALRLERERDHAARLDHQRAHAGAVQDLVAAAKIRGSQLTRELAALRRVIVEADEPVRALSRSPLQSGLRPAADLRARALAAELVTARSNPPVRLPTASGAADPAVLELRRELEQERSLRARFEAQLAEDRTRTAYMADAIEGIGRQLDAVRAGVSSPAAISEGDVGQATRHSGPRAGEYADQSAAGTVAPDRLAAALYRLREGSPPPGSESRGAAPAPPAPAPPAAAPAPPAAAPAPRTPGPQAPTACWLRPALKRLLREDPAIAGSIVIGLLPAQPLVLAGPARYDLALGATGCVAVTVRDDQTQIDVLATPRPLDDVDLRIEGDLAGLARLLVYGPLRRRLSRRVAGVRGNRRALSALDALVREPFSLRELHGAGVRLDPALTLQLVASMIDPSWTVGERFTLGHESRGGTGRAYLLVRDGAPPGVSRNPPLGPVASSILCPDEQLLTLLIDGSAPEAAVLGAPGPLAVLGGWIARAERGR